MARFRAFGGFLALFIVASLVLWAYILCVIGLPFGPQEAANGLFWAIIMAVSTAIPSILLYAIGMMLFHDEMGRMVATIDVVIWIIHILAMIVGFIFMVLAWVNCENNYVCDSLIPWGATSAPGVAVIRGRFMGTFILHCVMLIISIVGAVVAYYLSRFSRAALLRKYEESTSSDTTASPVGGCHGRGAYFGMRRK